MSFALALNILTLLAIYIILGVSLNLALGFTGLLNLAHVAFFGVGAYTSALLTKNLGVSFEIAFLLAGIAAAAFSLLVVLATKKLKGDYLALATLAFGFVFYSLLLNVQAITRGPLGIPAIPQAKIFGITLASNSISFLIFAGLVALATLAFSAKLVSSPFGKVMQATRDDELGLRVLGKNTTAVKYKAMAISAFFAGLAGSLFAHYISFIEPANFYLNEIILLLTIVILGGLASIKGSVAAALIVVLVQELLRFVPLPSMLVGPARQMFYALVLIVVLMTRPRGLFGRVDLK
ncbi:branched-chain amino acid ABC transporter permease [Candidatus Pacearchaeota archaeon]|nr:MAG: branched-chain amino acid ABC transporter permease [Candidatus Pacearchaeota archaeon]